MNLSRTVLGMTCANPTVLASGMMGIVAGGWRRLATECGCGVITTKSMWAAEHKGNADPVVLSVPEYTLNAVGLPYGGAEVARAEIGDYMTDKPAPLIASVVGLNAQDFVDIAEVVVPLRPDALEVNMSSPTFLKLRGSFLTEDEHEFSGIIGAVKKAAAGIPVLVKLSPNVPNIGEIARRCVAAGADGIVAINTVGPGMAIDLRSRMPILSARKGGVSGRAVKPIAVRCIADIYAATEGRTPIIGLGGVTTGEDAAELMLAGASLVGIGTAIWERGPEVFGLVAKELEVWCEAEGIKDVSELTGGMHRELASKGTPYA